MKTGYLKEQTLDGLYNEVFPACIEDCEPKDLVGDEDCYNIIFWPASEKFLRYVDGHNVMLNDTSINPSVFVLDSFYDKIMKSQKGN